MRNLRIGPNLKRALFDPDSFFWRRPANYDLDPISFQDPQGRYVACNIAFTNMARRPAQEIYGKLPADIFDDDVASAMDNSRMHATQDENPSSAFWQTFGHGPRLHMECRYKPIFDHSGSLVGFLALFGNITALTTAESSLCDTLEVLRHDLQNPLDATLFCLQEQILPSCNNADLMASMDDIQTLCRECRELIRICFRLPTANWLASPFRGQWITPDAMAELWHRQAMARFGATVNLAINVLRAEAIAWSPNHLADLILDLIQMMRDVSGIPPTTVIDVALAVESSVREHGATLEFHMPIVNEQAVDIQLSSHLEFLMANFNGIQVERSCQPGCTRLMVLVPRTEFAPLQTRVHSPAPDAVQDYEGEAFTAPRSFYQARFELTDTCAAILDADNRVLACDYGFASLFHGSPDALIQRHVMEFASPSFASCLHDMLLDPHTATGHVVRRKMMLLEDRITGGVVTLSKAKEGGRILYIYMRNRQQFHMFLKNHLHAAFVFVQSHLERLRRLYVDLLARLPASNPGRQDLHWLIRTNQDMLDLTSTWIQIHDIERSDYLFRPHLLDGRFLLEQVCEDARHRECLVEGLHLDDQRSSLDGIQLHGDSALLKAMFLNLLKNARQASRKGDIRLAVHTTPQHIHIDIRNDGEVPHSIREEFFEKFVKGSGSSGMGLGTYSAKRTVELHGGTIALDTSEPGYTTLHVALPLSNPDRPRE